MKQLICKECGSERDLGRKLCRACNLKRLSSSSKVRYETKGRYMYTLSCKACNTEFSGSRKTQKLCTNCNASKQKFRAEIKTTNTYIWKVNGKLHEHKFIAESILGKKLQTNEVVHHVDGDPKNNKLENLMVMTRSIHGKLHLFLDLQRVIWEKSQNENHGNCWNTLIVPITTTWLETTNVKVIKIWEIGQSAAEPLKQECNEEGSETKLMAS